MEALTLKTDALIQECVVAVRNGLFYRGAYLAVVVVEALSKV
jgi:hypothetical protein